MKIIADEYGLAKNFSAPFTEALKDVKNGDTIVFENKEYHFFKDYSQYKNIHFTNTDSFQNPTKYFGLLLENLNDISIEGNGATFVIHGDICSFGMINCHNVKLNDFTIRYASPSCVELKVASVKGKKVTYTIPESTLWYVDGKDIHFFEQSPFTKKNYWEFKNDEGSWESVYHSADGNTVQRIPHIKSVFSSIKTIERKSETEVEITYKKRRKFNIGDVYSFSTNKNRNTCGIFFGECSNVESTNLTVNYMAGFGWLSQLCENVSFENVTFKGDKDHVTSSFADLIHVCGCKGDVKINNCYFEQAHDDAINIHGSFMRFKEKIDEKTAIFEFVHRQQGGHRNFFVGNTAKFYYRGNLNELEGEYKIVAVEDYIEDKTTKITFDKPLPTDIEAKKLGQSNVVIENKSYCPNVEISNCTFTAIPTRDILCTTSGKVRIHDNSFSHSQMAHIFISNDASDWYESGPVRDVEIYQNRFYLQPSKYSRRPAISILPITFGRKLNKNIHQNIKIYGNYFKVGRDIAIRANAVNGLDVYGNYYDGSSRISTRHCKKAK